MKLTFIGAAHEVTGSCTLLECCGGNFLIDYGMEQGVNVFENVPLPVLPGQIDAVFLTHAHIDHSGMLPKLYKDGFRGKVYATRATENLCRIMLMDSAAIQMSDAEWLSRKAVRAGRATVDPIYTTEDAVGVLRLLGYCVGAKNWERYRSVLKFSLIFAFSLSTVLTLICYLFTGQIVSVFLTDAAAYDYGVSFAHILLCTSFLFGVIPEKCVIAIFHKTENPLSIILSGRVNITDRVV